MKKLVAAAVISAVALTGHAYADNMKEGTTTETTIKKETKVVKHKSKKTSSKKAAEKATSKAPAAGAKMEAKPAMGMQPAYPREWSHQGVYGSKANPNVRH